MKNILEILKKRFEKNKFVDITWEKIEEKILKNPEKLKILEKMENSGGEPNLVKIENNLLIFFDCSKESPKQRISLCYDEKVKKNRKNFPPESSVEKMQKEIGIDILDENDYRFLQTLGDFDTKTSSWIKTPEKIRELGGAIFSDYRYKNVFVYHNSADSYYSSRGFRGKLFI